MSIGHSRDQDTGTIKAVIKLQFAVIIIAMIAIKVLAPATFKSALYGSMVAWLNTGFLYWRMRRAYRNSNDNAKISLKLVQRSGLERFLLVGLLLAIGMTDALKLMPQVVLISFIGGQIMFLLGVALNPCKTKDIKTEAG